MSTPSSLLADRLGAAFSALARQDVDPDIRMSAHADYQSDAALTLAHLLGTSPRKLATDVVTSVDLDDLCSRVEVSGPGYINVTLDERLIERLLASMATDARLGMLPAQVPGRVVVDYSSPNAAKEMHVGHLRSTIIGDAAVRILEWLGHSVIRQNHVGDWGTPFGMLIEHSLDVGEATAVQALSVGNLNAFYQAARAKFDADPDLAERARRRVVVLQAGDQESLRLWRVLVTESAAYFDSIYRQLGVLLEPDDIVGESAYNPVLHAVLAELTEAGLVKESDGALCVFPSGFEGRSGEPLPLIVQKRDGGFGYAATDLAAIRHRLFDLGADRLLYVVGQPQSRHLAMLFQTATEAGWLVPPLRAEHIGFGSVLGASGKMLKTRSGQTVRLAELLEEAVARARSRVIEKNPELGADELDEAAHTIGIGAIKYADLSTARERDYSLDFDRMLSFEGNTGPYLQYAYTRVVSIFRKGDLMQGESTSGALQLPPTEVSFVLADPLERDLALQLLAFPDVMTEVESTLEFHRLCTYLFEVASAFSVFYRHCPVLQAQEPIRSSRLALAQLTARILHLGLRLLGIATPDRM